MCRPGTSAVAVGTAGFEAETTSSPTSPGSASQGPAAGGPPAVSRPLTTLGAASRQATAGFRSLAAGAARFGRPLVPAAPPRPELPCRDDPELFFAESPEDVEFAKTLCGSCPVRPSCLTGALERREPWGVWGGELFERGAVVPRKRPRGRPRKTEVAA